MSVQTASANGILIAYETVGDPADRPLLLVAGLAQQMLSWHDDLCAALADRGFFVVRFDNRDAGLSTRMTDAPRPDVRAALSGDTSSASYTLDDLADDAAGLVEALGLGSAHVLGASMGGMIAQVLAVRHPHRVRSLTSVMSTPGPRLGPPTRAASAVLLAAPPPDRAGAVARAVEDYRVLGSPGFPYDEQWRADMAGRSWDRGPGGVGVARQLLAIHASGDRTEALRQLRVPTLVVHGADDPLVQLEGGRATAEAVPGAELLVVPGMGHDLPREVWPQLTDAVVRLADRAEA